MVISLSDRLNKEVGILLRKARQTKGMAQTDLAVILHVTQPYICNVENGKENLTIAQLAKILSCLNLSVDLKLKPYFEDAEEEENKRKVWKVLGLLD